VTFPLNRVVAFAGPYISILAAAIAAWLVAKANVLGVKGLDQANVATQVAGALTFTLVAVLSWLGQSKWLTGHQLQLAGDAEVQAAALAAGTAAAPVDAPVDDEHLALLALPEDLPEDEVEFASQPPGIAPVTPQPPPQADALADDEEFSDPPDQGARMVPDAPGLEEEGAEDDWSLEEEIRVAPEVAS
jgi:hypothetical protein